MVKLIDGKKIADKVKKNIAQEIFSLNLGRPNLAIILIGERADSKLYVSLKERESKKVGVDTHIYYFNEDILEEDVLTAINFLNEDPIVDGILVQLPLPKKFDTNKIIQTINPLKDVDGFHPEHPEYIESPVIAAIEACLDEVKFLDKNKSACVLYNSKIFGESVVAALKKRNFQLVENNKSNAADLLITALGDPGKIKQENIKEQAVVIDIGITKIDDKVFGDVDFESVKNKASYITPVPGGIGPMTIAFLFKNVLEIFKRRN